MLTPLSRVLRKAIPAFVTLKTDGATTEDITAAFNDNQEAQQRAFSSAGYSTGFLEGIGQKFSRVTATDSTGLPLRRKAILWFA